MMFGEGILEKLASVVLGGVVLLGVGAYYGNEYGANAKRVADIKAELNRKNEELVRLQAEDAVIAAQEWEQASRADAEFSKVAPGLKKCVLDRSQVEALNKIGGTP